MGGTTSRVAMDPEDLRVAAKSGADLIAGSGGAALRRSGTQAS